MPISNIPGVGPTNSDIAAATAAVVPNSAAITAAVPTAAQIATAVAAPSASTIATAVAASVPTLTQINNSIATNSSPFGGTFTNVALSTASSTNSITFSGLSGYKFYRLVMAGLGPSGTAALQMRFNGDAGNNYAYFTALQAVTSNNLSGDTGFRISPNAGSVRGAIIDIPYANSTTADKTCYVIDSVTTAAEFGSFGGVWASTAPITSITLFWTSAATSNWYVRLIGGN